MLKVGELHVFLVMMLMIVIVSLMILDQRDIMSANSHTFMRKHFILIVVKLQVHHLQIKDARILSKAKE